MRTRTALLGTLALLTMSSGALADNQMKLIDKERELYRATFEGGSLTEFVEMLREGLDGRIMFISPERGDEIRMPRFDIANVDASQVIVLSRVIANVPPVEVDPDLAPTPFSMGEGVPVYIFDTSMVPAPERPSQTIASLEFKGGTVAQYVEALKNAGAAGRVVITGDPGDVPMQAVSLKNVTVEAAVRILDGIEQSSGATMREVGVEYIDGLFRVHVLSRTRTTETTSRVWSLRAMTASGLESDVLLGAIEAGLETLDSANQPNLRYHEPTSLLIAVGDGASLGLIEAIIRGLDQTASVSTHTMTPLDRMRQQRDSLMRERERVLTTLHSTIERTHDLEAEIQLARDQADAAADEGVSGVEVMMLDRVATLNAELRDNRVLADALESRAETVEVLRNQLEQLIAQTESGERDPLPRDVLMQEFGL